MRIIETPADFAQLMRDCQLRVKYYVDLANNKFGLALVYPKVKFNLKGTTAGRAGGNLIEFSPTLLRENADHFLEQTVGHEVAHLVADYKYPDASPHGDEWAHVMAGFGLPATRCHKYDVSHVPTRLGKRPKINGPVIYNEEIGKVRPIGLGKVIEFD